MAKSVLEYVQDCLSVMDSDDVSTISETVESQQIADLLKETYYEFLNRDDWAWLKGPITMTAAGSPDLTKFTIGETIKSVSWIYYNVATTPTDLEQRKLEYKCPEEFILLNSDGDNRTVITDGTTIKYVIATDRMPKYWTSFDDESIVCDAYDSSVDASGLVATRMSIYGIAIPTFTVSDAFTPDVPNHVEPMLQALLNEAAFNYFKQIASPIDTARVQRQMAHLRRTESKLTRKDYYANKYGRK